MLPGIMNVSFSGGGFLGSFHLGVLAHMRRALVPVEAWAGASIGSVVAVAAATGIDPDVLDARLESVLATTRGHYLGAFQPGFHLVDFVRSELDMLLPANAHEICRNRLFIAVARRNGWRGFTGMLVSDFSSRRMLLDVVCASSNLPGFSSPVLSHRHHQQHPHQDHVHEAHRHYPLDGGLFDNFPSVPNGLKTVLVSPFPGKFDISPPFDETKHKPAIFVSYKENAFEISARSMAFWAQAAAVPSPAQAQRLFQLGFRCSEAYFDGSLK